LNSIYTGWSVRGKTPQAIENHKEKFTVNFRPVVPGAETRRGQSHGLDDLDFKHDPSK